MCLLLDSTVDRYVISCKSCVFVDTHLVLLMDLCKYFVIYQSLWINVIMDYLHLKELERRNASLSICFICIAYCSFCNFQIRSYSSDHLGVGGVSG